MPDYDHVFTSTEIKNKLISLAGREKDKIRRKKLGAMGASVTYAKEETRREQLDAAPLLASSGTLVEASNSQTQLALRNQLQEKNDALKPPIFEGWFLSELMLTWPVFFSGLGILIFLLASRGATRIPPATSQACQPRFLGTSPSL